MKKLLLNCMYYGGVSLFAMTALKYNVTDLRFWTEAVIFSALLIFHNDIDNFINRK